MSLEKNHNILFSIYPEEVSDMTGFSLESIESIKKEAILEFDYSNLNETMVETFVNLSKTYSSRDKKTNFSDDFTLAEIDTDDFFIFYTKEDLRFAISESLESEVANPILSILDELVLSFNLWSRYFDLDEIIEEVNAFVEYYFHHYKKEV